MSAAHGTFLGHIRLEPHKPQQIPIDSTVSFGASTRQYTLREKPQALPSALKGDDKGDDDELKGLLGLPEEETELDVSGLNCPKSCTLQLLVRVHLSAVWSEKERLHKLILFEGSFYLVLYCNLQLGFRTIKFRCPLYKVKELILPLPVTI